jgi:phosphoglycolate phosphatase
MKYKMCIFDLDGTTVDTLDSIADTANRVLADHGLGTHPRESYKTFVGDGQFELIKRALAAAGDEGLVNYKSCMDEYVRLFATDCVKGVKAYDGMREVLGAIKARGILIATFSNKRHDNVLTVVDKVYGEGFFDQVLGQMDSYPKKPAPDGALIIADKCGIPYCQCLYVGDTGTDMQTGNAAGMDTVGVTWGFRTREELGSFGAKWIIDSPGQLLEILDD